VIEQGPFALVLHRPRHKIAISALPKSDVAHAIMSTRPNTIFEREMHRIAAKSTLMSALGQNQTFPRVRLMSALPPKADIVPRDDNVCFVQKGDILPATRRSCGYS
jgi:hypothetical protein